MTDLHVRPLTPVQIPALQLNVGRTFGASAGRKETIDLARQVLDELWSGTDWNRLTDAASCGLIAEHVASGLQRDLFSQATLSALLDLSSSATTSTLGGVSRSTAPLLSGIVPALNSGAAVRCTLQSERIVHVHQEIWKVLVSLETLVQAKARTTLVVTTSTGLAPKPLPTPDIQVVLQITGRRNLLVFGPTTPSDGHDLPTPLLRGSFRAEPGSILVLPPEWLAVPAPLDVASGALEVQLRPFDTWELLRTLENLTGGLGTETLQAGASELNKPALGTTSTIQRLLRSRPRDDLSRMWLAQLPPRNVLSAGIVRGIEDGGEAMKLRSVCPGGAHQLAAGSESEITFAVAQHLVTCQRDSSERIRAWFGGEQVLLPAVDGSDPPNGESTMIRTHAAQLAAAGLMGHDIWDDT